MQSFLTGQPLKFKWNSELDGGGIVPASSKLRGHFSQGQNL